MKRKKIIGATNAGNDEIKENTESHRGSSKKNLNLHAYYAY